MAITNASRVADFGSGIGTEGAVLQVDNTNNRLGIGTTNPQAMLQVGTAVTVYGNSGIVSATKFYGDGSNITNAGSTLAAGSGAQRVVVTSLTTGTMTSAATDADLAWNSSTNTLSATNITGDVTGDVTGNTSGTAGGLSGSPNITINNLVGVAATFSGVVTYEDVTNVDSLGIITARGGIEFGASGVGGTITAVGNAEFVGITTARGGFEIGASGVGGTITAVGNAEFVGITTARGGIEFGAAGVGGTITSVGNAEFAGVTTSKGNLNVGSAITAYAATGIVSATAFYGDGAALSGVVSGIEVKSGGSSVGTSLTALNFSGATVTTASSGITTITISAGGGISTAAGTSAGIVTTLYLSDAQDHKMTASGITTITCSGGSEGESHTVRITNSGITTVGFSTYFLWPSGSAPSIPTADGTLSLISFTVQRVGTAGTQLLAGASLNFS